MSLVMSMNKIQTPGDYSKFFETSKNYALSVYDNASEDIKQVFLDIIWSLLIKMNVPAEEAQEAIKQLEVSGMGYLFENAEKMDIQAERRNTKEAREAAAAAQKRADAAEQKMQSMDHILDLMLKELIRQWKVSGMTKEEMLKSLQFHYSLEEAEALNKINQHWN